MNAAQVVEMLKQRFPNEPEYIQAVSQVLPTIEVLPRFLVFDKEQMFVYRDLIIRSGDLVCNTLFFSCTRLGTTTGYLLLKCPILLDRSFITA